MALRSGTVKRFLSKNDIINNLYPESLSLVLPEDPRTIIVPTSLILVTYNVLPLGVVLFGGDPGLRIGYPNVLESLVSSPVNLTATVSKFLRFNPSNTASGGQDLSLFVNQPLVMSLSDSSAATGAAIVTLIDGGADYAVDDFIYPDHGNFNVRPVTVDGSGKVLTFSVGHNFGNVPYGGIDTTTTDEAGTGLTLSFIVTQGNGSLYIEFDWKDIQVPKFARYS